MSVINMCGGPNEFAKAFSFPMDVKESPESYYTYECHTHKWRGENSRYFGCPSCYVDWEKVCYYCRKTFKIIDADDLLTIPRNVRKPYECTHPGVIRKYSKGKRSVVYFCSGACYQSHEKNKREEPVCIIC